MIVSAAILQDASHTGKQSENVDESCSQITTGTTGRFSYPPLPETGRKPTLEAAISTAF